VLLRDRDHGVETLMVRRDQSLAFAGGAWVFPGGRVDPEDYGAGVEVANADDAAVLAAARTAAVRETAEEAGLRIDGDALVWFSHWTPAPRLATRRFSTWFFAGNAPDGEVVIDDDEIRAHEWVRPVDVLARHRAGDVELLPPTWMTLVDLSRDTTVEALLARFRSRPAVYYLSNIAQRADGITVAMWAGDIGYDDGDADRPGARHRLVMDPSGWELEQT